MISHQCLMNEQHIITKIQSEYIAEISSNHCISLLPRNIVLDQLNDLEQSTLHMLISQYFNLLLTITFKNIKTHTRLELNQENKDEVINHASEYCIDQISFNLSSAIIWISLYYDVEISLLSQKNGRPSSLNLSAIIVALLISIGFFYLFFKLNDTLPEIIQFMLFGIGFLALGYIFEKIRHFFPKRKKMHDTEQKFLVAQYLACQLEVFATDHFKLDPPEWSEEH